MSRWRWCKHYKVATNMWKQVATSWINLWSVCGGSMMRTSLAQIWPCQPLLIRRCNHSIWGYTIDELALHHKVSIFSFLELLTWIKGRLGCIWKACKLAKLIRDQVQVFLKCSPSHHITFGSRKERVKSNTFWKFNLNHRIVLTCNSHHGFIRNPIRMF